MYFCSWISMFQSILLTISCTLKVEALSSYWVVLWMNEFIYSTYIMTYWLHMVVRGTGAQKYVVQLVKYLLCDVILYLPMCDVILYLPICKANFIFKYVGSSWIHVWGTQLDCAKPNQDMCDQIITGVDERDNMASWVLHFVSMSRYASKMTDHMEKSAKSASCIQTRWDKIIMWTSCWHWVGMSRRQSMLKSSKMNRVTLICKGKNISKLTHFVL